MEGGYAHELQEYSPSNILRVNTVKYLTEHMPHIRFLHNFLNAYGYKDKYAHTGHSYSTLFIFRNTLKGQLMKAACILKKRSDAYVFEAEQKQDGLTAPDHAHDGRPSGQPPDEA